MIFRVATAVAALSLLAGAATVAPAQSFSSSAGLGLPLEGVDARARALGGVGTGLFGTDLSVYNPAGSATIPAATLRAAFQPEQRTLQGQPESFTTMRLPLLQAAFRFGEQWTGSVAYHGVFDQRWAVSREDTIPLGGEDVAVLDHYRSDGGISRLVLSGAFEPVEGLSVGAGLQLYTGSSTREVSRQFERGFDPAQTVGEWSYRGAGITLGGRWQPTEALVAGAAVEIGGTLDARASAAEAGTEAAARSYSLPLAVRAGASGRITQELGAVLSADWTGWSAADGDFVGGHGARDSWMVAGGLEWEPVGEGFVLPLRIGGRMAALPFHAPGGDWLDERALSGGVGARLGDGAVRADAALERGWRTGDAAGAGEDFWRASISLTVFGR